MRVYYEDHWMQKIRLDGVIIQAVEPKELKLKGLIMIVMIKPSHPYEK
jgi:hypothetical protein